MTAYAVGHLVVIFAKRRRYFIIADMKFHHHAMKHAFIEYDDILATHNSLRYAYYFGINASYWPTINVFERMARDNIF